jgi:hypothetical protein
MYILPSVLPWHSAKCIFAERLGVGTRQRLMPLTTVRSWRAFAECHSLPSARHSVKKTLPSVLFCRVPDTQQRMNLPYIFLYRVPDILHSAKLHLAKSSFPVVHDSKRHAQDTHLE